ncbi:MAG: cyclic nucleotide-binding domain-containing protein [Candidatus Sericytochromatia bacterium]|nr:cyclic nucleotide-binding domain-containing protein [Candidatus Sericytochromatia bacterium]
MPTLADIATIPFFEGLTADEHTALAQYATRQTFAKGAVIFYEGDPGNALCLVLDGAVTIGKEDVDGALMMVSMIGRQDIFGEGALIDDVRRSATAIAATNAVVLMLKKTSFEALSHEQPQLAIQVLRRIARIIRNRLRKASADLVDLLPH